MQGALPVPRLPGAIRLLQASLRDGSHYAHGVSTR
jgi:hypothetical protein